MKLQTTQNPFSYAKPIRGDLGSIHFRPISLAYTTTSSQTHKPEWGNLIFPTEPSFNTSSIGEGLLIEPCKDYTLAGYGLSKAESSAQKTSFVTAIRKLSPLQKSQKGREL